MSSSRFVSGGTDEAPIERDAEWRAAQAEITARHAARTAAQQQPSNHTSLYETLQANKAAKQEAFEESIKLRHQFRTLDEDEVEFLDTILESTRRQEASVKRETAEQVEAFRRRRNEVDKEAAAAAGAGEIAPDAQQMKDTAAVSWSTSAAGRKRKSGGGDRGLAGVKFRRVPASTNDAEEGNEEKDIAARRREAAATLPRSTGIKSAVNAGSGITKPAVPQPDQSKTSARPVAQENGSPAKEASLLGLAAYDDEDDDW